MTPTTPTEAQMKLADVTDADRDAAAELAESLPDRSEDIDIDEIAEAFALHRQATEARAQGLVDAARKKGQDEGFAAAVQWLRDRSAQKPAAYLALEADVLANGLENSRIPYAASPIGEIG